MYLNLTNPEDFDRGVRALPLLKSALPYTDDLWTLEDVGQAVAEGRMQMWVHGESVAVTQLEVYPTKLLAHIFLGAGTLTELHELLAQIEEWATDVGADRLVVSGRKGWVRDLKSHGFKEAAVTVAKELHHGR